jgi:tetratricopeptide (TPR) repeat protein
MNLHQSIERATELHRAGHLHEAECIYRQVLAVQPNNSDVIQLLGLLASQLGNHAGAVDLIREAIALKPTAGLYHANLGLALDKLGRWKEAVASFQKALDFGFSDPNIFCNYGDTQRKLGNLDASLALFARALALKPGFPEAKCNLGIALVNAGRLDEAIAQYREAIRLRPEYAEAHNNLGNALLKKRLIPEALAEFQTAQSLKPDYFEAIMNLGVALQDMGEADRAIEAYRRSLTIKPDFYEAFINLGQAYCDVRQFDKAIAAFRSAIKIRPDDPSAHFHLSGVLLLTGNYSDGWREYEWRLLKPEMGHSETKFSKPRWSGEDLRGKRILLHAEQGVGDLIQFSRLIPILTERGAQTILGCPPFLIRLFKSAKGISELVTEADERKFDYHCYLLSLPLLLGLKLQTVPADVPYLHADAELVEKWKKTLAPLENRKKIGLVWAGNPLHTNDHNRSIPPANFARLAEIEDVAFVSLQKEKRAEQTPPAELKLIDHTIRLSDYAETAGLIANLDLVISVDTSVAHLAGAMGKPVWTLLPYYPDLRWLLDRPDSPWYPTMRLFRQPRRNDWQTPIRAVAEALRSFTASSP